MKLKFVKRTELYTIKKNAPNISNLSNKSDLQQDTFYWKEFYIIDF